jgi:lipopolysaccharide/colanic/teichoic acid biosynthesis glycosyltransferase
VFSTTLLGRPDNSFRGDRVWPEVLALLALSSESTTGSPGIAGSHESVATKGPEGIRPARVPFEPDRGFYLRYGKRFLDLCLGGVLFIASMPLLILLAAAIKIDTRGPVLYRSTRVGRGGKTFVFYKLRSMIRSAEKDRERIAHLNEVDGPVFKIARDPRITRVGRILRKTSLDELPQLLNVLRGDMSMVGPRPPIPAEVEQYEPWQMRRLSVLPGITCIWQVSGRSRLTFEEWMQLDMQYVERRSFALDLSLILRTIPAVLGGKGAY